MIKSLKFPKKGSGYLYDKYTRPVKPERNYYIYWETVFGQRGPGRAFNQGRWDRDWNQYQEEMAAYTAHKGEYLLPCSNLLLGRRFEFAPAKVNLIFGPNASGKTTMVKAIAGEAQTSDGWTALYRPLDLHMPFFREDRGDDPAKTVSECLAKTILKNKGNTCDVVWDGAPVYYHNLEGRTKHNYGEIGSLCGSLFKGIEDEVVYRMTESRVSLGQKSMYILNKLLSMASEPMSMEGLLSGYGEDMKSANEEWFNTYKCQLDRFKGYPKYSENAPATFLFDELDKSLDIETVWKLYRYVLPAVVKKTGCQIIIISHSPLVLTDDIYSNPMYNIVSTDEAYTEEMRGMLHGVSF